MNAKTETQPNHETIPVAQNKALATQVAITVAPVNQAAEEAGSSQPEVTPPILDISPDSSRPECPDLEFKGSHPMNQTPLFVNFEPVSFHQADILSIPTNKVRPGIVWFENDCIVVVLFLEAAQRTKFVQALRGKDFKVNLATEVEECYAIAFLDDQSRKFPLRYYHFKGTSSAIMDDNNQIGFLFMPAPLSLSPLLIPYPQDQAALFASGKWVIVHSTLPANPFSWFIMHCASSRDAHTLARSMRRRKPARIPNEDRVVSFAVWDPAYTEPKVVHTKDPKIPFDMAGFKKLVLERINRQQWQAGPLVANKPAQVAPQEQALGTEEKPTPAPEH